MKEQEDLSIEKEQDKVYQLRKENLKKRKGLKEEKKICLDKREEAKKTFEDQKVSFGKYRYLVSYDAKDEPIVYLV